MATTPPPVSLTPNVTNTVAAIASNLGFVAGDPVINSKIALLILQAIIIISLSRGLGFVFAYLKEPLVIAEMVAGILLGPTVMGRIPGFTENIFPPSSLPLLQICAQLGLMLFMFVVGLELDVGLLKRKLKSAVAASVIGVIVPQIVAIPLLWVYYKDEFLGHDHHVSRGAFFLFLGIVLAISALPVLARIMSEYNFLNTPLGVFTMTATTVDDMIAWPMLALAIALAGAKKTITILYILLLVVADVVLLFIVVRPAFILVARFAAQRGTNQTALFLSLLIMLCLSFFCEISGLTYLVGAFQAGLVVPRTNGFATALAQKIEHVVVVIFMPLFFAFSGIRTQFAVLNTARLWGLTFLLTFAASLSKMAACVPSARYIAKLSWRDSIAFGILMNTKGLVALISINLGLDYSIISRVLFAQMLIMVLINTCITGPLIALLDCLMPAPQEAQPPINRDVALLYSPGTETANSLSLFQLASTLNSPVRSCDLLLFRLLDAEEPSVYIALSRNKDPVAAAAKSLARKNDVKLRVQYETSSAQVDALVQAAEHAQFVFAAWTHQALPGELAAALRRTSRALLFLVEPSEVSVVPPDSDESDANSLSMPRVPEHGNKPASDAAAPAPAAATASSSTTTDSGDGDARVRFLLPCLPERLQETESVLELVLRMMQGSRDMELVFVHIVPTGQSEIIRQQGRLLLRLLNARGMQVVWRETDQPADFGVIRTEARTQRATHVVLPLESPASWAEELSSLSVPVLLVRPEVRKEKEAEEPLL